MSLFKIFKGKEEGLDAIPRHEGYAYFTTDKGNLYIDISSDKAASEDGSEPATQGTRVQVNAEGAKYLLDGDTQLSVDDVFLREMTATVAQGGTGRSTLTANAVLVGNGTNSVKLVSVSNGQFVVGDATNGIKGVTAATARTNLDVYSKAETDSKINKVETISATLAVASWVTSGSKFTYTLSVTGLMCGKAHNVPPTIAPTSNVTDYSKIESAVATAASSSTTNGTIVFTATAKPTAAIGITITDVK